MSVNLGTAEGKIILDTSGFVTALQSAQQGVTQFSSMITMRLGGALQSIGSSFTAFGNMINSAISRPLQNFAKSALEELADFEDGLNRAAVIAGANADELQALSNKAKEMGRTTKFSATQATEALQYMGMAGWKTEQMLDGLEGIMNLAAASGEDLASVSDIVTDALTAFKLEAKDAGHFADVLTAATLNSNTTVGMLGEAFKYVAPLAGTMGYSIEDVSLALGLMANSSIKSSQAGTSLAGALRRMSTQPGIVKDKMAELGLTLYDTAGNAKPLGQVLQEVREKFRGMNTEAKVTNAAIVFGARAMPGLLAIINAGGEDFEKLKKALNDCEGAAKKTAEAMMGDLQGQILLLQSTLSAFKLQFQNEVLPVFTDWVRKIREFVEKIANLDAGARKAIVALIAFGAALGPLVTGFGSFLVLVGGGIVSIGLLVSTIGELAALVGVSAAAFTGWGAVIIAALGAVAAGVAVASAAIADLMINSADFRHSVEMTLNEIMGILADFEAEVVAVFNDAGYQVKDFKDVLFVAWEYIKGVVGPTALFVMQQIKNTIEYVFSALTNAIKVVNGIILIAKGQWSEGISKIFEGIEGTFTAFYKHIFESLYSVFAYISELLRGVSNASETSKKQLEQSADGFSEAFLEAAQSVEKSGKKIESSVKNTAENARELTEKETQYANDNLTRLLEEAGYSAEEIAEVIPGYGKDAGAGFLEGISDSVQKIPGVINAERYPVKTEADKLGTDLIDSGDLAGSGYVGIMDAHLSTLPERIKPHFDLALQYSDSFADSFIDNGESAGDFFVSGVDNEIKKLPAKLKGYFDTILANTTAWGTSMAAAAKTMATNFNTNASAAATNFSAELNKKLKASLDVANTWVSNMASKGAEGAKLFLQAMTDAVDAQGPEIQVFGEHIAEEVIAGLQGKMEWFRNQLKGMFLDAIDKTKEDLGIYDTASKSSAKTAATSAAMRVSYASDYDIGAGVISAQKGAEGGLTAASTAASSAGTTTINFYSPTAINEIEASRLLRQTQREIALGF